MEGASSIGGAPNVDGPAGTSNLGGAANLDGAASGAVPGAPGAAGVSGGLPSGGGGAPNVSVQGDAVLGTQGVVNEVGFAQSDASGASVEAGVSRTLGADGQAVVSGGGAAAGERHAAGLAGDPGGVVQNAARGEPIAVSATGDAAIGQAGVHDPRGDLARAEQLQFNERDQVMAQADVAGNARDEARNTVADPRGAAAAKVEQAATAEATQRAPIDPGQAQADVNVATSAIRNPGVAAGARVELEADAQARDAAATLGTEGTGTGRHRPEPGGDDET